MSSAVSVQLDSKDLGEQLTKLFPKCRPRDLNLNHLQTQTRHDARNLINNNSFVMELRKEITRFGEELEETGHEEDENESGESACSTSDDDLNNDDDMGVDHSCGSEGQGQVIVLQSNKGATYKLRDSRIIEIAGGRELFSASRSKALRSKPAKPSNVDHSLESRNKSSGRTPTSRELTETVFSTEIHSVKLQRDISGAIVFDDIEEPSSTTSTAPGRSWRRERRDRRDSVGSSPSPPSYHQSPSDFFKQVTSSLHGNEAKELKMIGGIPIAEYEGSPRRYGPRPAEAINSTRTGLPSAQSLLSSPSLGPTRSNFHQRPLPENSTSQKENSPAVSPTDPSSNCTFDYLYEFSETRKVLEEFFKQSDTDSTKHDFQEFDELGYELRRQAGTGPGSGTGSGSGSAYVGLRLAKNPAPHQDPPDVYNTKSYRLENDGADLSLGSVSTEDLGDTEVGLQVGHSRNFTLSPETTDCESNCGDLDSEVSLLLMDSDGHHHNAAGDNIEATSAAQQDCSRLFSAMPVLEDGLSSGHASDTDNNNASLVMMKRQLSRRPAHTLTQATQAPICSVMNGAPKMKETRTFDSDLEIESLDPLANCQSTPPPPAPVPHRSSIVESSDTTETVEAALKDIRQTLQRTKTLPGKANSSETSASPIWVPRRQTRDGDSDCSRKSRNGDDAVVEEEEADTDLETDRLLGQQRTDDHGFYEDKVGWKKPKSRTVMPATTPSSVVVATPEHEPPGTTHSPPPSVPSKPKKDKDGGKKKGRNKEVLIHDPSVLIEGVLFRARYLGSTQLVCEGQPTKSTRMMQAEEAVSRIKAEVPNPTARDVLARAPSPGIPLPATVFRLLFLGSVEVDEESGRKRRKRLKKAMVEEAVSKIKAPEGETQPSTEVDLFISTEKIMVLNTDLKEIMMDHALRTISYIADIGDLVVLMARRRYVPHDVEDPGKFGRAPKMICHVFESEEAQFIAQSIGQAFQVAYMEFLKANGIEDHSFVKEMDYQEVLNSQEIFGDELQMFAKKEMQKEVVVPKAKGEMLGVVIVESGWGSMLPTVVIANLAPAGAAARCGHLNIGDQIIAINGVSLVGLPLSTCQTYIKNTKNQTVVKLTVVPCAPVVEVKIKRPDTKYQLGFSVQNGVICSLLRGGIAERGGVRVGHRIIEINNQSVVAVPHEKIVNLLATSVGEILMKTMPTSMFRLLTGQETPLYI